MLSHRMQDLHLNNGIMQDCIGNNEETGQLGYQLYSTIGYQGHITRSKLTDFRKALGLKVWSEL